MQATQLVMYSNFHQENINVNSIGSNPAAASFLFTHPHAIEKVTSNSTLESILKQVEQRSQGT